jgi:hypothetical protein
MLSSCGSTNDAAVPFTIPMSEIGADLQENKYLQIIAPEGWNSFKTGESISLMARNVSENQIAFAPDFGARIFIRTDKEWVEVGNKITYKNDPSTLDPSDDWYVDKTISPIVDPVLPDNSVPCDIRIFIIGDLMENGKMSKKVGSYIDLRLNP